MQEKRCRKQKVVIVVPNATEQERIPILLARSVSLVWVLEFYQFLAKLAMEMGFNKTL